MDSYARKVPKVHRWLLHQRRFVVHAYGSSWLNLGQRFFAKITNQAV